MKSSATVYILEGPKTRDEVDPFDVKVSDVDPPGQPTEGNPTLRFKSRELAPRFDLVNHSPTGFSWGYAGSGPAQLAIAILADYFGNDRFALAHYQRFKFDVIAKIPREGRLISGVEILAWAHRALEIYTRPLLCPICDVDLNADPFSSELPFGHTRAAAAAMHAWNVHVTKELKSKIRLEESGVDVILTLELDELQSWIDTEGAMIDALSRWHAENRIPESAPISSDPPASNSSVDSDIPF